MQIETVPGPAVLHRYNIHGAPIAVYDEENSIAADIVATELTMDSYGLCGARFSPGDAILDIGGHIGLFAIAAAFRFPGVRIYSYEPCPGNFSLFERNLALNGIANVDLYPEGLSGDGRPITLSGNPTNSGGMTAHSVTLEHARCTGVPTLTLDQIFDRHRIDRCRLLKIDCEGSEYEALTSTGIWPRVEYLCGEFHSNQLLESRGCSQQRLEDYCVERLGRERVRIHFCGISE